MNKPIGEYFDDPDKLFNWLDDALVGMIVGNVLNVSGVTDEILKGPSGAEQLASKCELPLDKLKRLLDFLVGHKLLERDDRGVYTATERTQNLRDAAGFLAMCEVGAMAGTQLLPALRRRGATPFELYFGKPVFDYFSEQPQQAAAFGDMMGWMTRRVQRFLFSQHRFEPFETIVDVGGSMGDLLLSILGKYPGSQGILFDLPQVVEMARPKIATSPHADRVQIVGGSFFEEIPAADLYTLKQILHDWHDDECKQILRCIRTAINPGGRVAVIDHIISDPPVADEAQTTDIAMMFWDTGRERKMEDFEALFDATGFRLERITRNPNGHSVIEAAPI